MFAWTAFLSVQPVYAGDFWDRFCREYKRNQYWPEPFIWADRKATIAPFGQMVANGWRRQNLMSDYHFNDTDTQLNVAGEDKLRYILTQMPPSRRTIFVQRGLTPEETASRINLVHNAAIRIVPAGYVPDVQESDLPNDGWPADDTDAVARRFNATRPDPRLQSMQGGGDPNGSSSSNSW
ncbi:MAG: hypothetical protein AB7U73_00480 [Pirellulales bacterium]